MDEGQAPSTPRCPLSRCSRRESASGTSSLNLLLSLIPSRTWTQHNTPPPPAETSPSLLVRYPCPQLH